MSESTMTREELLAQNTQLKVEVRMLAAAGAAKAAARAAAAAATAAGKKPLMKTEFDRMTPQRKMQLMKQISSGESDCQLIDDRDL